MMPAGRYYVGDLCYVMHPEWDEVCGIMFDTPKPGAVQDGEFTLKDGRRFAVHSTAYGDGCYRSNKGTMHSVDAGLIGCILVSDIQDNEYTQEFLQGLGAFVEFTEPFTTSSGRGTRGWDGIIRFGDLEIYTGDEEAEYNEEEEYDCED